MVFRNIALLLVVAAGTAQAQSPEVHAQQQAERAEAQRELEEQRNELREAQRALEAAAREVARLSVSGVGPQIQQIVKEFKVTGRRAMLGITIEEGKGGAIVEGVSPGGPAEQAGVKSGDLITQLNDLSLVDSNVPTRVLIEAMADVEPGDDVVLKLKRNGREETVTVATAEFEPRAYTFAYEGGVAPDVVFEFDSDEKHRFAPRMHEIRPWSQMELVELTPELGSYFGTEEGILVVRAPDQEGLDLRDGDVILEIGDREPRSTGHAMRILGSFESGEAMSIEIMRNKRRRTVKFEVPEDNRMSRRRR